MPEYKKDLSKNNRFSAGEEINYIPGSGKRKKVPVCEMLESSGLCPSSMLPILSWKLKITTYRGSFAIPPSSKLELLCQYEMTSWHYIIVKCPIIDDLEVRDPPLVCLFSVFTCSKSERGALEQGVKSVQS